MRDDEAPTEVERGREPRPEPHEPPVLTELGRYADLTRGQAGQSPDSLEGVSG